jgi:hypothetical protein
MNAEGKDGTVAELYVRLLGAEVRKDVRCGHKSMLLVREHWMPKPETRRFRGALSAIRGLLDFPYQKRAMGRCYCMSLKLG